MLEARCRGRVRVSILLQRNHTLLMALTTINTELLFKEVRAQDQLIACFLLPSLIAITQDSIAIVVGNITDALDRTWPDLVFTLRGRHDRELVRSEA